MESLGILSPGSTEFQTFGGAGTESLDTNCTLSSETASLSQELLPRFASCQPLAPQGQAPGYPPCPQVPAPPDPSAHLHHTLPRRAAHRAATSPVGVWGRMGGQHTEEGMDNAMQRGSCGRREGGGRGREGQTCLRS